MTKYFCFILLCMLYLHFETADGADHFIESIEIEEIEEVIDKTFEDDY